ncbi:tyrosine-type recombinase/integrase [Nitrosophilus labii]|uniref:tyrosine-type recombinase/integrase n=1 Tax=Nitrosophilus labii TaxID=2706014 RepID=UPI0016576333|nr:tyrosine-type recombinase/integrase [Nitrosophilus labii]
MKLDSGDFIRDLERWFKAYMAHIKGLSYSNNTIQLYNRAIEQFIEYSRGFQDEMTIKDVKGAYITGYLAYIDDIAKISGKKSLSGKGLSKSTKQTYLKAIRGFFIFISDNNDDLYTFERYLKNIRIADSSKKEEKMEYLTEEEVGRLLSTLEREKAKKDNYNIYRNALLIKLMLYAGLRISEALKMKIGDFEDIDDKTYRIRLEAKGGKEQFAYIGKNLIEDELEYFKKIAELKKNEPIMITRRGKLLNRQNAFKIVNRIYRQANIFKQGLHLLRHTLAMRLTKRGVDPIRIQKILRHSNINTTLIYARAEERDIIESLENF